MIARIPVEGVAVVGHLHRAITSRRGCDQGLRQTSPGDERSGRHKWRPCHRARAVALRCRAVLRIEQVDGASPTVDDDLSVARAGDRKRVWLLWACRG